MPVEGVGCGSTPRCNGYDPNACLSCAPSLAFENEKHGGASAIDAQDQESRDRTLGAHLPASTVLGVRE